VHIPLVNPLPSIVDRPSYRRPLPRQILSLTSTTAGIMAATLWPLALALLLPLASAQQAGWLPGQINTTMCQWQLPRGMALQCDSGTSSNASTVGVVRDTAYIDGGIVLWQPEMADGSAVQPVQDREWYHGRAHLAKALTLSENPDGLVYTLNFSIPFKTSDNFSDIISTTTSAVAGTANNIAPNYLDGALLANDDEFFLYGGLTFKSVGYDAPDGDDDLGYRAFWDGGEGSIFKPGWFSQKLSAGVTRYVAFGGGVSVPSENKGYYFGGMQSKSRGPVYQVSGNATIDPTIYSHRLITLDMTRQQGETWKNESIGTGIPDRASPEVAWVPVGLNGILVVMGGAVDPIFASGTSSNTAAQRADGVCPSPSLKANRHPSNIVSF
jgi:hypothetical protein